jgi:DNA polymerase-4
VGERLRKYGLKGKTIQISIKDNLLFYIEKQEKLIYPTFITKEIASKAYDIFKKNWSWSKPVRALGIRMCDLVMEDDPFQLSIYYDQQKQQKLESIDMCVDRLRERYGHYSIQRCSIIKEQKLNANPVEENIIFPVSYFK